MMEFLTAWGLQAHFENTSNKQQQENEYNLGNLICFVEIVNAAGVLQYVAIICVWLNDFGRHFAVDKWTQMKK